MSHPNGDSIGEWVAIQDEMARELIEAKREFFSSLENKPRIEDRQFILRAWTRALCAAVDAWSYLLKQWILSYDTEGVIKLDFGHKVIIDQHTYHLNDNGTIGVNWRTLNIVRHFKFTFNLYAKYINPGVKPEFNAGWRSFKNMVDIRNRITHPKCAADLQLSKTDEEDIVNAATWWANQMWKLLDLGERDY